MEPYYYYDELPVTMPDEALFVFLGIFLMIFAVVMAVALVFWIFRSIGLHQIAKRRGIRHAWMAWIPIGSQWVLGSVSDQYQHLIQGKITSRRKILLVLNVASLVIGLGSGILTVLQAIAAQTEVGVVAWSFAGMLTPLLTWGIGIATLVFNHICSYDLYRSCNPDNAVVFLVLGIILPVTEPFFYFACRKKDLGFLRYSEPAAPAEPAEPPRMNPEF